MGTDNTVMFTEQYRPYAVEDIIGQGRTKKKIGGWLRQDRIPRSILISGVTSSGKTTFARIIARAVLCLDRKDGMACTKCQSCVQFDTNRDAHPAYIEMNAASERGIGDMRDLTKKLGHRPIMSKKKVIVLDEAHMITKPGWNAMLKPLEEPPPHIIFAVLTTDPQKIPSTILGRLSKVRLSGITVDECTQLLLEVSKGQGLGKAGVEKKHLVDIAKATKAHPREALHALDQVYTMVLDAQEAGQTVDDVIINGFIEDVAVSDIDNMAAQVVRKVLAGKAGGALKIAADYSDEADQLLSACTEMMRQAMMLSTFPKLLDPYYKKVFDDIDLFKLTPAALPPDEDGKKKANPHSIAARRAVLEAYACFTRLRIETSNYTVPVGEVFGECIARAALTVQEFLKTTNQPSKKAKNGTTATKKTGTKKSRPQEASA